MSAPALTSKARRSLRLFGFAALPVLALAGVVQITGVGIDILVVATAALMLFGYKASFGVARFALSFLAVQCMLNALSDLRWLFWLSVSGSERTDAQNMAVATYGIVPAVVWSILWAVIAFVILIGALRLYYVTTVRRSFGPGQPF